MQSSVQCLLGVLSKETRLQVDETTQSVQYPMQKIQIFTQALKKFVSS